MCWQVLSGARGLSALQFCARLKRRKKTKRAAKGSRKDYNLWWAPTLHLWLSKVVNWLAK
jgi:hypothetical protein